jgi:Flp pilus assembly protein TadG
MKRKMSGQITVEMAIVFPIVMMVVASLIYFSLYVHDVIAIKSVAYSAGIQNIEKDFDRFERAVKKKMKAAPVFVTSMQVLCSEQSTYYQIEINSQSGKYIKWLSDLTGLTGSSQTNQVLKIEKKISKEILYGYRAVSNEIIEKNSDK